MSRLLGSLVLLATGFVVVAMGLGAGPAAPNVFGAGALSLPRVLDGGSYALGVLSGLAAAVLYRVPWSAIPGVILGWIIGWRRNFVLMSLATVFASVLLLY